MNALTVEALPPRAQVMGRHSAKFDERLELHDATYEDVVAELEKAIAERINGDRLLDEVHLQPFKLTVRFCNCESMPIDLMVACEYENTTLPQPVEALLSLDANSVRVIDSTHPRPIEAVYTVE